MKTLIVISLIVASTLQAQMLPELFPHAMKHRGETIEMKAKKKAVLEKSKATYLDLLTSADAAATSAGNVLALAAITQEKESLAAGSLPEEAPKALPKPLQSPRKSYLILLTRVSSDFAAKQKRIDSDYLRALGGLQSKADANPTLTEQIAQEKKLLLSPAAQALEIRLATYQGLEGQNPLDVTSKLRDLLAAGSPSVKFSPATMGGDPIAFHAKCLVLDYVVDGVEKRKKFGDGETLVFKELLK